MRTDMKNTLAKNTRKLEIARQIKGPRIGKIVKIDKDRQVFVDFPDNNQGPVKARFTSSIKSKVLQDNMINNQEVLLVFENNDPASPIIIDTLFSDDQDTSESLNAFEIEKPEDVFIDGKRVTFDAREEIVLRCGKASITLTKAGKVLIRGGLFTEPLFRC